MSRETTRAIYVMALEKAKAMVEHYEKIIADHDANNKLVFPEHPCVPTKPAYFN